MTVLRNVSQQNYASIDYVVRARPDQLLTTRLE